MMQLKEVKGGQLTCPHNPTLNMVECNSVRCWYGYEIVGLQGQNSYMNNSNNPIKGTDSDYQPLQP